MAINQLVDYHRLAQDKAEAALLTLEAGMDVELPSIDCFGQPIIDAVEEGRLPIALVDQAVRRVLAMKFRVGLFENPYVDPDKVLDVYDTPEQRRLARTIAQKSMVLLKNEGSLSAAGQGHQLHCRHRPQCRQQTEPAGRLLLSGPHRDSDHLQGTGLLPAPAAGLHPPAPTTTRP